MQKNYEVMSNFYTALKMLYTYALSHKWDIMRILNTSWWDEDLKEKNRVKDAKNVDFALQC